MNEVLMVSLTFRISGERFIFRITLLFSDEERGDMAVNNATQDPSSLSSVLTDSDHKDPL